MRRGAHARSAGWRAATDRDRTGPIARVSVSDAGFVFILEPALLIEKMSHARARINGFERVKVASSSEGAAP